MASPAKRTRALVSLTVACAILMTVAACDDDNEGTVVGVTLQEFSVTTTRATAPQGTITFNVSNIGEDDHEFVVIATDLAPNALPTEPDGSYEEDGPGTEVIEEIELIEPGNSAPLTLNLVAGSYVLICNMVHIEDDEVEAHYALGMRTAFTVE